MGGLLIGGLGQAAFGQTPPLPDPAVPPAANSEANPTREAQLEERIHQLEGMVKQLANQVNTLSEPAQPGPAVGVYDPNGTPGVGPGLTSGGTPASGGDTGPPGATAAPSAMGGVSAPGQSNPPAPAPSARFNSPATLDNFPGKVKFGPGFEIRADNDEYILQFHNLTQFDYRGFEQGGQVNVRNTFLFPRQWFMFSGRVSKQFGYFVSFANGFDSFSLLDVFADIDYSPKLRIRAGRFKTPFTYEFFVEPIQGLTVPERSIFFNNFALNRDDGVMAFGRLFGQKLDYAGGIFNGTRNGLIDADNSKDVAGFLNYRPFDEWKDTALENFNIGGSFYAGQQEHAPIPQVLRTIVPTTGNSVAGIPFLAFNTNVRESGFRAFWDLHAAWYYKQLAVVGEWGSGASQYATTVNLRDRDRIGVQSFYAQASYLLTGETRGNIGLVKPIHPFNPTKGNFGTGAIEPFARFEYMDVSNNVFSQGLADPNLWSNRVWMNWVGVNWHLTQYVKVYLAWNHAEFGNPVLFNTSPVARKQLTSDEFMLRFQLYF
ncbi:porin [Isosphaeraceae bacterium EP7]